MEWTKQNNNRVIIISPGDIQAHGRKLGIDDITIDESVQLLDEIFNDTDDPTDLFPNINSIIQEHVQWAASGDDVNWDDPEEVASECKRKCLLNRRLRFNYTEDRFYPMNPL